MGWYRQEAPDADAPVRHRDNGRLILKNRSRANNERSAMHQFARKSLSNLGNELPPFLFEHSVIDQAKHLQQEGIRHELELSFSMKNVTGHSYER